MIRTPRVPAYSAVKVGSLLTGPQEDQYVVTRKEDGGYWTAELSDVRAFAEGGAVYEDRYAPEGWDDGAYPQTLAGTAPERIVAAVRRAEAHADAVREVMVRVKPADHRRLYNAVHDVHACTAEIPRSAGTSGRFRDLRRRETEKVVDITGSLPAAAKVLGLDEDTVRGYLNG